METPDRQDDQTVRNEEEAAGTEAGSIGGQGSGEDTDPAEQPLAEGGGGEAEGFEEAEADLVENASHGDGAGNPESDAFSGEVESDLSGAEYGEADEVDPTEVVRDPEEGDDQPGEGPGLAAER